MKEKEDDQPILLIKLSIPFSAISPHRNKKREKGEIRLGWSNLKYVKKRKEKKKPIRDLKINNLEKKKEGVCVNSRVDENAVLDDRDSESDARLATFLVL